MQSAAPGPVRTEFGRMSTVMDILDEDPIENLSQGLQSMLCRLCLTEEQKMQEGQAKAKHICMNDDFCKEKSLVGHMPAYELMCAGARLLHKWWLFIGNVAPCQHALFL